MEGFLSLEWVSFKLLVAYLVDVHLYNYSARESRKRKKTMIEELQRTVITLSRENKDLNERNEQLRRQLIEIGGKVRSTYFVSWFHFVKREIRLMCRTHTRNPRRRSTIVTLQMCRFYVTLLAMAM